jgi:hypothetical protein
MYAHALEEVQYGIHNFTMDECAGENWDIRRKVYVKTNKIVPCS